MRLLTLLLLVALPAAAQPWRYINKQGVATYTTNPNDLPPAQRKKALAQLEQKRLQLALEAEAAAAAAAAAPSIPVVVSPESVAPGSAAPGSAAPDSAPEKKPPTVHEIWEGKVSEAGKKVEGLAADLAAAQVAADEAGRRAMITPSGQNSAQHASAQEKLKAVQAEFQGAQELLERLRKAEPRK